MKISEILDKAADLIEPEGAWCQRATALDRNGRNVVGQSPLAVRRCQLGAIDAATGGVFAPGNGGAVAALCGWEMAAFGCVDVIAWHDASERTQSEVIAAMRAAAAAERAKELA